MLRKIKNEIQLGKAFATFAVLRMLGQGLMFIVPLVIARYFSPEEFGVYSLSMMIVYFFSTLFINASQKSFIVYASDELAEEGAIKKAFTIRLIFIFSSIIIFSFISLIFLNPLTAFASIEKTQFMFLFLAYVGMGIRFSFETIFLALGRQIMSAWYEIVTGVISVLYIFVAYYFFVLNLESVLLMFLVAPLLAFPFLFKWTEPRKLFPLVFDKKLFKKMFDYTKWTMLGGAAMYFISWGDNLVLRYFVPLEEIGEYNLGYQIFKGTIMLMWAVKIYFLPFISANIDNVKKIRIYLYRKRPKIMALGLLVIAAIFLVVPYFFSFFYEGVYGQSIVVAHILLIAAVFVLYQSFYSPLFDAMRRYRFTELTDVVFVIANLTLDVILVTKFGMIGAAIATTLVYIGSSIAYEIYFRTQCKNVVYDPEKLSPV